MYAFARTTFRFAGARTISSAPATATGRGCLALVATRRHLATMTSTLRASAFFFGGFRIRELRASA